MAGGKVRDIQKVMAALASPIRAGVVRASDPGQPMPNHPTRPKQRDSA